MTRHISPEQLAKYRADALPRWRARRVHSHLALCASCAQLDTDLSAVPDLLASVPAPACPEPVALMVRNALARETAQQAMADAQAAAHQRVRRGWQLPQLGLLGRRPVLLRATAATAAVAVLAFGGVEIAEHAGESAPPAAPAEPHYTAVPFVAPAPPPSGTGPTLTYTSNGQHYAINAITTGTNFTPGQLSAQASQLARSPGAVAPGGATGGPVRGPGSGVAPTSGVFQNFSVADLNGCMNRITGGDMMVLLVDVASYQGQPAAVIVTGPSPGGAQQVWVVGIQCSATHDDTLAHTEIHTGS